MSKVWKEQLPCLLTRDELLERGESLALIEAEIATCESKAKADAKRAKDQITELESEQARLALIVREKAEPRPIDVTEFRDFAAQRVDHVRSDTGEVVRTRVMTDAERQLELMPAAEAQAQQQQRAATA